MKNIYVILILYTFLSACGDVGKVLRNEKIKTTDEFLVKKKSPLVLPPDFDKIPIPGTLKSNNENSKNPIKKILKAPKEKIQKKKSTSVEKSILEKIKK